MSKNLAEKFISNQASPSETLKVLEWFETPEGKLYLQEKLANDEILMDRQELGDMAPELDSESLYSLIQQDFRKSFKTRDKFSLNRTDWLVYVVKAAAVVLITVVATIFTISHERYTASQVVDRTPVKFQTDEEQQRQITLGDGSVVRINSLSELIVSEDFMQGSRKIILSGEAYFDVVHDPEQPFIIHTKESIVEVLGTAFNVRSLSGQNNVQVAVIDGRVAFRSANGASEEDELSVILSKGQYGYMDIVERNILVDDLAVENYLAWKNGQFVFDGLTLTQVCTQLNRIYGTECSFDSREVMNFQLTSKFSDDSLEKALEVIAISLELEYEIDGNRVYWSMK